MEPEAESVIPTIEKVAVDPEKLRKWTSEHDFNGLAVSLMVEFGSHVCVASCLLPASTKAWNRNQAVLGGLMTRFYKLTSALLDQTCQQRGETAFIFGRLAFECLANIRYLLLVDTEELYEAFVAYSLRHEKQLYERISRNIEGRLGESLPIERRMLASIERSARISEIALEDVTAKGYGPWKNKNFFERCDAVGLGEAYLGLFGGPSHAIHGNWQDLVNHHLETTENGFRPDLSWSPSRPQILLSIAKLGIEMLMEYFLHVAGDAAQPMIDDLNDFATRLAVADEEHETFLSRRQRV